MLLISAGNKPDIVYWTFSVKFMHSAKKVLSKRELRCSMPKNILRFALKHHISRWHDICIVQDISNEMRVIKWQVFWLQADVDL